MSNDQWQIKKGGEKCAGSDKTLEPGEEYYAALIETNEGFDRIDYSVDYWNHQQPAVYCFWKTRVPVKEEKKKLFVDDAILVNIFERLENEQDPMKINFRFVLALILMRKKLLKYEDTLREGDQEIWKMKMAREEKVHQVTNPHLTDEKIEQVSVELSTILHGEL